MLSVQYSIGTQQLLAATKDRASVNEVAVRSGIAKVGHMPHQLNVVPHQKNFGTENLKSNHDIIQANSNYILSSNIPKSSITPISLVSNGSILDHKLRQCILIVWNIPFNCGLKFEDG